MTQASAPPPSPHEPGQVAPGPATPNGPQRTAKAKAPARDKGRRRPRGGRRDARRLLRESGLPRRLQLVVFDVVQRTRLWKSERANVAIELIDHFAKGLSRGEEAETLEVAFGSTPRTARLIRRAKRRQRPWLWKAWVRSLQVVGILLAVVVALYVAATIRLIVGKPTIEHDYLADVTATARAVPEAQRAWPQYRQAIQSLGPMPEALTRGPDHPRPGDPGWAAIESYLEANREALALTRTATALPGLGYEVGYQVDEADATLWPHLAAAEHGSVTRGTLWSILLPHLAELRRLSVLLALDAHRAATEGDGAAVVANIEAILGIARHTRETALVGSDLSSLGQVGLAVAAVGEILASQPEVLTDGQLGELAHRLAALHGGLLEIRLEAEVLAFEDLMQRLYTDDGEGDGRLTAEGLAALGGVGGEVGPLGPAVGLVIAGRKEMTSEFNRWFGLAEAELAKPLWRQDAAKVDRELERLRDSKFYSLRYRPIVLLMPAVTRAGRLPELVAQERDAVLVAIGLELYRRRAEYWPASLEALVPDLLPAVPRDRFDGNPLRYRLVDGRPLLYSVGSDRVDNEGVAPKNAAGRDEPQRAKRVNLAGEPLAEGDWVLWPPAARSVPKVDEQQRAEQETAVSGS